MKARWVFVYGALLLLLANGAYGGRYQRTKDRETLVWNNQRGGADEVTWAGDRDPNGYATGQGTLTWYRVQRKIETGSNLPTARGGRSFVVSRYSGKMVRGKLDGPVVNVDANGKTFHATFVDGSRVGEWAAGPTPGPSSPRNESVSPRRPDRTGIAVDQRRDERVPRAELVEAPAEGPSQVQTREVRGQRPEITGRPADQHVSGPTVTETPSPGVDDSLRALIGPPSLLRMTAAASASSQASIPPKASSSPADPRLTRGEVIHLADVEARRQGYALGEYQRPQVHYTRADDTWSVSYDQKSADGMLGKHFSVSVEDKTKKTSMALQKQSAAEANAQR